MGYGKRKTKRKTTKARKRVRKSRKMVSGVSGGQSMRGNARSAFDPLPNVMKATFRYVTNGTLSTSGSTAQGYAYRMSSPYAPYVGIGGSSSQNWGLATTYYGKYRVDKIRVKVCFTDPSGDGLTVGLAPRNLGQASAITQTIDYLTADNYVSMADLNNSGSQNKTFVKTFYPWQFMCDSRLRYAVDDTYSASTNATPINCANFEVFVIKMAGGSAISCNHRLEIDYHITLYDKKFA